MPAPKRTKGQNMCKALRNHSPDHIQGQIKCPQKGRAQSRNFAAFMQLGLRPDFSFWPVTVGHLPAGGTLGGIQSYMSGYFGKYYSQIDCASHSAKRSVLGLWCQGIQTFAKGRQVCPVHTDMGPCGQGTCVFHGNMAQKKNSILNSFKTQRTKSSSNTYR